MHDEKLDELWVVHRGPSDVERLCGTIHFSDLLRLKQREQHLSHDNTDILADSEDPAFDENPPV
jgi:hypothetical protein